jgi:hypothetical protein
MEYHEVHVSNLVPHLKIMEDRYMLKAKLFSLFDTTLRLSKQKRVTKEGVHRVLLELSTTKVLAIHNKRAKPKKTN